MLRGQGVPVADLIGDLPIALDEAGGVRSAVEWGLFADFMQRLERHLGGPEAIERLGELIGSFKPASFLRSIAGLTASPYLLYRAASHLALRRAMPGVLTRIDEVAPGQIEIYCELATGLRACPQIFSFATGVNRALPRLLGSQNAVVKADIGIRSAHFRIAVPPSRTLAARIRRLARAVFSSGSMLQFMETQQLELHAKHDSLERTHAALAESEQRYRAITDAALDVLVEIDEDGRVVYVSASIQDLIGYSPEQVTGSHFRLWIPSRFHTQASQSFNTIASEPPGRSISRELVTLHAAHGARVVAEVSVRSYRTPEGAWRMVGILRDVTDHSRSQRSRPTAPSLRMSGRTAHEIQGLRAAIGRIRDDQPGHPIEHSLSRLLVALETPFAGDNEIHLDDMVDATRRMTQVVESAMARAPDPASKSHWIDGAALARMIEEDFEAIRRAESPGLAIDLSRAPAEVWSEDVLLGAALGSLIDWAIAESAEPLDADAGTASRGAIRLSITSSASHDQVGSSAVFSISTPAGVRDRTGPSDPTFATKAKLAQAIARDIVTVLGAEVAFEAAHDGSVVARLRLPQPDPAS